MKVLSILFSLLALGAQAQDLQLGIKTSGIYKINPDFIHRHAPELRNVPPENLRIRGGHPDVLPQKNAENRTKGWESIPTQLVRDGAQWSLFFYATGGEENPYSSTNAYFLSEGTANPLVQSKERREETPINALLYRERHEEDKVNLLNSGRLWLGDLFKGSYTLRHDYSNYQDDFRLKARIYPVGISRQFLGIEHRGSVRMDTLKGAPYHPSMARYERVSNAYDIELTGEPTPVRFLLSAESVGNAGVYMDYWEVSYRRKLGLNSGQIRYELENTTAPLAWPRSDQQLLFWQWFSPWHAEELRLDARHRLHPRPEKSFLLAFVPKDILLPQAQGKVKYPALLGTKAPELLVVFPEAFRIEAEQLIQYKREKEGLDILGVSVQDIYLQYSSGKVDPSAIRDFCRQLYLENPQKFKALLLLGDASFDYRNSQEAPYVDLEKLVPTYLSRESLEPIYSYASDDYFGFLETHEGDWPEGYSVHNQWQSTTSRDHTLDIAVGRIPARTRVELIQYLEKYKNYRPGTWAKDLTFVADNRDYNLHQQDARALEELALRQFPGYRTQTLYLDAFPVQNGQTPEANIHLKETIEKGTFLLTYIGHGAEDGWTNEKLLGLTDIMALKNEGRLPIFLTATCAFGRFDQPGKVSGAELLLLRPNGGAMALLSTTRPVYSSTNQALNHAFFTHLNTSPTLGEAFRKTKNQSIRGEINRNFSLLGDPTLALPIFQNQGDLHLSTEELATLEVLQVHGSSPDVQAGWVDLTLLNAPAQKKTLGTFEDGPAFSYLDYSEELSKARFQIENFQWKGTISLPLTHRQGKGRVLARYSNGEETYQHFSGKEISYVTQPAGGTGLPGPDISAQLTQNQEILLHLRDEDGLILKGMRVFINDLELKNSDQYYQAIFDNTYATLQLPLARLPSGKITVTFIGADIYNNVSQKTFTFEINRAELQISGVLVYPNPAEDLVHFKVKHNRAGDDLEGSIYLFDAQGGKKLEVPLNCTACGEEVRWTVDVQQLGLSGEKGYYQLSLKSASSGSFEKSGGILFFWK